MATFEERLAAIEQEHAELKHDNAELKQKIELQTIAIGALVNKAALERLNERHDKLFESLIAHDQFTNAQLSELRDQQTELDGKIAGLQIEMRQSFEQQDGKIVGMQTEVRQGFNEIKALITALSPKPDQES